MTRIGAMKHRRDGAPTQSRARRDEARTTRPWWKPIAMSARVPGRRTNEFVAVLLLTLALVFIGLVLLLSASTVTALADGGSPWFYLQRQGVWAVIGLVVMSVAMRIDYRDLAKISPVFVAVTAALLILVLIPSVGDTVNGARRWISFGPLRLQPSELVKLTVALFAAEVISRRATLVHDNAKVLYPVLAVSGLLAGLVLVQRSQGTAAIIVAITLILLFLGGVSIWSLGTVSIGCLGLFVFLAMSTPYRRDRIDAWGDPWNDPDGSGYQPIQSMVGIASGGLGGVGLGEGRAKWGFLPFAHTDFIFSVAAEELGFIGSVALILIFVALAGFGLRIAFSAPDRLGMLLAAGITTAITMQAFINIGVALNVLPISGVTLPFVSSGGSSLVVNLAAMGVVLNVARQTQRA